MIKYPEFKLVNKHLKLRITPCLSKNEKSLNTNKYSLPDSTYGEWIIFQNSLPRFYFCAFNKDGANNRIVSYAIDNNLDIGNYLVDLLRLKGYKKLDTKNNKCLGILLEDKSSIQEFKLMQLIDS